MTIIESYYCRLCQVPCIFFMQNEILQRKIILYLLFISSEKKLWFINIWSIQISTGTFYDQDWKMKAESKYETWQGKFRNLRFKFQQNYFFVTAQIVEIYIEYMYVVCEYKKKTGKKQACDKLFVPVSKRVQMKFIFMDKVHVF